MLDAEGGGATVGGLGSWDFGERWVDLIDAVGAGGGSALRVEEYPRPATTEGRGWWARAGVAAARTRKGQASLYCTRSSGTWPGCGVSLAPTRVNRVL